MLLELRDHGSASVQTDKYHEWGRVSVGYCRTLMYGTGEFSLLCMRTPLRTGPGPRALLRRLLPYAPVNESLLESAFARMFQKSGRLAYGKPLAPRILMVSGRKGESVAM